jgi:hypothetical protein
MARVPRHPSLFQPKQPPPIYLLSPHNGAPPPPPPLFARKIPFCAWESIKRPALGHAASPGECLDIGQFLNFALSVAHKRANTMCTMYFFNFSQQISLPFLQSCKKTASTVPILSPTPFGSVLDYCRMMRPLSPLILLDTATL